MVRITLARAERRRSSDYPSRPSIQLAARKTTPGNGQNNARRVHGDARPVPLEKDTRAAAPARTSVARGTTLSSTRLMFSWRAGELGEAPLKRIQVHGLGFRWQLEGMKGRQRYAMARR